MGRRRAFARWRVLGALAVPLVALGLLSSNPTRQPGREQVDWIWSARYVLTMDPQRRIIEDGAVAVKGDRIVAVGGRDSIRARFQARNHIQEPRAVLAPGLINAHTHVPMSLLRGLADDLPLQRWLQEYIFPAEARNVNPEFIRWGTRLACLEMALGGTTTFAEMYYFEDLIAEETRRAGLRAVLGETILNLPAPDFPSFEQALAYTESFIRRYAGDPLITPAVAPHALYTNSAESLQRSRQLANRYGVPLMIHLAETREERERALATYGASPVQALDQLGLFEGRTLAAHCVWVDKADIELLARRKVGVVHCPSSNMKLASGVAPLVDLLRAGVAVGLGTDGPAGSNNDLNLFEEMDLAAKLQKVVTGDPTVLPAHQVLAMATIEGARVLGMEKEIGSLEPSKRADMILIRLDSAHALPFYNLYSQLVYALKASDVAHVMVNGRLVVRSRQMLTLDASQVLSAAEDFRRRIQLQH